VLLLVFSPFASNSTLEYDPLLGINHTPLDLPLIIGLSVAGGVILLGIIIGLIVFCFLKRRSHQYQKL